MDTSQAPVMHVHWRDGTIMSFLEHPSGLNVVYDANLCPNTKSTATAYSLLSTVADHNKLFSKRQICTADTARTLYRLIGRPEEAEFESILRSNLIRNCPVTPDDAKRSLLIYGPDIAVLKGKMTRSAASPRILTYDAVPIPSIILDFHRNITLCVNFVVVQGVGFLHTISRSIGFRTVAAVPDPSYKTILKKVFHAIKLYQIRGFTVQDVHADQEFEYLRDVLQPIQINIVPADSHVGEIEHSIRTVKDRLRSCIHGLPFKRIPKLMLRHMVSNSVRCLNQFPRTNGISFTLSPPLQLPLAPDPPTTPPCALNLDPTYKCLKTLADPTNTSRARSHDAIALTPPATTRERGLVVEWQPDQPIDDDEYDPIFVPRPDTPDNFLLPADFDPVDPTELADLAAPVFVPAPNPRPLPQGAFHEGDNNNDNDDNHDNHDATNEEIHYYHNDEEDTNNVPNDDDQSSDEGNHDKQANHQDVPGTLED